MSEQVVECVPNFSEGKDVAVIRQILAGIEAHSNIRILDVYAGAASNRTVVSLVGPPDRICDAVFDGVNIAMQLIDMRVQRGLHARVGSADVIPFVPLGNQPMETCVKLAERLGQRIGQDLNIPVVLYGEASTQDGRSTAVAARKGGYAKLSKRIATGTEYPDYGPNVVSGQHGIILVGARSLLIAYNINLATKDVVLAKQIACAVRAKGAVRRSAQGSIIRSKDGRAVRDKGLPYCEASAWFVDAPAICQVTTNLSRYDVTGLHHVYEHISKLAAHWGVSVIGSEIVGLVPEQALLDAGEYYLTQRSHVSDGQSSIAGKSLAHKESHQLRLKTAVESLGLDQVQKFCIEHKVLENKLKNRELDIKARGFMC